jgi:hypothetical protein
MRACIGEFREMWQKLDARASHRWPAFVAQQAE